MSISFKSFSHVGSGASNQAKNLSFKSTTEEKKPIFPPPCSNPREIGPIIDNFKKIRRNNEAKDSAENPTETPTVELPTIEGTIPEAKPVIETPTKAMPATDTSSQKKISPAEAREIINKYIKDHAKKN